MKPGTFRLDASDRNDKSSRLQLEGRLQRERALLLSNAQWTRGEPSLCRDNYRRIGKPQAKLSDLREISLPVDL